MATSIKVQIDYEDDLYAWSRQQAMLLRARETEGLDWDHLAEEILSMAGRDRRELKNRLRIVLLHLLKWQTQPAKRGASWRKSLRTQRRHIRDLFQLSPSLRSQVPALMRQSYPDAIKDAVDETGLQSDRFPLDCPYTPSVVLSEDYLPENDLGL